jgi:hypothetical protein
MGVIDFTKTVKKNDGKPGRNNVDIYLSGYHMLGGLVAGLIITKILEKTDVKDMAQKEKITKGILTGHPIENVGDGIKLEKLALMTLSTALTFGEVFMGVKGGASAGAGMILGYTYLNSGGSYIGEAKG